MPVHSRAVVFDLDGTLVETVADIHAVLAEVLAEVGLTAPMLPAVRGMIGDGAKVLIEWALAARGHDADLDTLHRRFTERYAEVPCRHSTPFDGAAELLAALRRDGWRLGLCTNKPHAPTLGLLRALGLEAAFDVVVGGDRLRGIRKPDPPNSPRCWPSSARRRAPPSRCERIGSASWVCRRPAEIGRGRPISDPGADVSGCTSDTASG